MLLNFITFNYKGANMGKNTRTYMLGVRLNPEEKKELQNTATRKKLSMASFVRFIIYEYITKNK